MLSDGHMEEYDRPYLVNRFGRKDYTGWERLYTLYAGPLMERILADLGEDRILYCWDPLWWKGPEGWRCPRILLDNVFGVIPGFDGEGELESLQLVDLVGADALMDFPVAGGRLMKACKDLLTFAKKLLREKGIEWNGEYRKGYKYLYNLDGGAEAPSVIGWDLYRDISAKAKELLRARLMKTDGTTTFNTYPDFGEEVYQGICARIDGLLGRTDGLSPALIAALRRAGASLYGRDLCASLYDEARKYEYKFTINRAVGFICGALSGAMISKGDNSAS